MFIWNKSGRTIYDVLNRLKEDTPGYDLLHRVFHDQYVVEKGKVELKDKHKVSSDSLQSPDDPDATYRDKDGHKVSGYVTFWERAATVYIASWRPFLTQ